VFDLDGHTESQHWGITGARQAAPEVGIWEASPFTGFGSPNWRAYPFVSMQPGLRAGLVMGNAVIAGDLKFRFGCWLSRSVTTGRPALAMHPNSRQNQISAPLVRPILLLRRFEESPS
jgi:hypothetical protein